MATVPASKFVNINANVLSAGGNLVAMNGMFLTDNTLLPLGNPVSYANADDVALVFGSSSVEHRMAAVYFNGYSIASAKPGKLWFYRVSGAPTHATLTGGVITDSIAILGEQDFNTLTLTVDGVLQTSAAIIYSTAVSMTEVAQRIQDAFTTPNFTVTWNSSLSKLVITSDSAGTGSTIGVVSSNGHTDALKLTTSTGAVIVNGTAGSIAAPDTIMDALVAITRDWATFTTTFEPTLALKKGFADWVSTKNAEYSYICWDSDANSIVVNPALDNIYNYLQTNALDNTFVVTKDPAITLDLFKQAAFVSGVAASIDFNATNNRPTFAFKSQSGLTPGITNQSKGDNIETNGGNYYVDTSSKNTDFKFLYPGQVSGVFHWMDDLINAIYMKATLQNTLMTLQTSVPSIPYNQQGYQGLIATALHPTIQSFINYGAIRIGVTLSGTQIAALNFKAGRDITQALFNKGYVLDVLDPGAIVRASRGSPIINLYYTSGGAVHTINLTATLIQ